MQDTDQSYFINELFDALKDLFANFRPAVVEWSANGQKI